jgi:hypothetical protein
LVSYTRINERARGKVEEEEEGEEEEEEEEDRLVQWKRGWGRPGNF